MFSVFLPISITDTTIDFYSLEGEVSVNKEEFTKAVRELFMWRENISATNFSAALFRLMCHADSNNAAKFVKGFPEYAVAYSLWYYSFTEEKFKESMQEIFKLNPEEVQNA